MKRIIAPTAALTVLASPAFAATGDYGFFSLKNTDLIVALGLIVFIAILVYYKVPTLLTGLLDKRADGIRSDLDEAKALREEAQSLLASFQRKQKEVQAQADDIVVAAREEAAAAAERAKAEIKTSVARRLAAAEEQIEGAKAAALRDVRNQAVSVAIAAARDVIASQQTAESANALIDASIEEVAAKMH